MRSLKIIYAMVLCIPLISMGSEVVPSVSPVSLASVSRSMPALTAAVSAGVEKACVPTHLTVSGPAAGGSRFYASALVQNLTAEVRKSARSGAKLSREQAHEIQRLVNYAEAAQKSALGFSKEVLEHFSVASGLNVQAHLVCLSTEDVAAPSSAASPHDK